jgi:putative SOS response-associated peptidase YedK
MCGLYAFRKSADEIAALFRLGQSPMLAPRAHVTPGGPMAILRPSLSGPIELAHVRWGLIPSWVKEVQPGKPLINARAETVLEKASFKLAMKRRRCLVPADGFYEWQGDVPGQKQPWIFEGEGGHCFTFAGLWESWMGADGSEMESACIITTEANGAVAPIHHRMPVVIAPKDRDSWLDCTNVDATQACVLLHAPEPDFFHAQKTIIGKPPKPKPDNQLSFF